MIDPKVCDIIEGNPHIKRPDLAEAKLKSVNEMVNHINYFRGHEQESN
jgi:hypothetical protein